MVDVGHELELARLHRERQHDEHERETTRREEETTNGNDELTEQPDEQQPSDPALVNNVPAEAGTMDVLCRDATPEAS